MLQTDNSSNASPEGYYVLNIVTKVRPKFLWKASSLQQAMQSDAEADLLPVLTKLEAPLLWVCVIGSHPKKYYPQQN